MNTNRSRSILIFAVVSILILFVGCDNKADNKINNREQKRQSVLLELNKLNSLTVMGINYNDYTRKLIEVKPTIDALLADLPADDFSEAARESLQAYIDARSFWEICNKRSDRLGLASFSESERNYYRKYISEWNTYTSGRVPEVTSESVKLFWLYAQISPDERKALDRKNDEKKQAKEKEEKAVIQRVKEIEAQEAQEAQEKKRQLKIEKMEARQAELVAVAVARQKEIESLKASCVAGGTVFNREAIKLSSDSGITTIPKESELYVLEKLSETKMQVRYKFNAYRDMDFEVEINAVKSTQNTK
jgi:hypothetical protein